MLVYPYFFCAPVVIAQTHLVLLRTCYPAGDDGDQGREVRPDADESLLPDRPALEAGTPPAEGGPLEAGAPPEDPRPGVGHAQPPVAVAGEGRFRRGDVWPVESTTSPWQVARIFRSGVHIGWGATCSRHTDCADFERARPPTCKKALVVVGDEGRRAVKAWLLAGVGIATGSAEGRSVHLRMNPRTLVYRDEASLGAEAVALWP